MAKHLTKFIVLICLVISIVSIVLIMRGRDQESSPSVTRPHTPLIAKAEPPGETTVGSPDGKMTLKMQENKGREGVTYIFWILAADGSTKEVFRKTLPPVSSLSIPFNTFSPDNKYFFLKQNDPGGASYFALSTSEIPITKDSPTLDIGSLFTAKYPNYKISDMTGWGGLTLIVINTDKAEGGEGPSFWFDVSSGSFIQLSSRFN